MSLIEDFKHMKWLPLAGGALLTFFSDKLCHREKNVPQMKLLGVALAVVGALMVFTV